MRYISPQDVIQKRLAGRVKPNWRIGVICFRDIEGSGTLITKLHAVPLAQRILSGMDYPGDRPYVYEARTGGNRVGVISGCWWGGPQSAIMVEELSCMGVQYIIGFGAAGSISRNLPKYTKIVASRGLTTDGTSRAYTKAKSVSADADLVKTLQSIKGNLKHEVVPVTIATVDAICQETDAAVQKWVRLGAQAVNMETTPFYAASNLCGMKSLWLGYVSDCLLGDQWDDWWDAPKTLDEDTADITVALIESLVAKTR